MLAGCLLAALLLFLGPRLFLIGVWLLTDWYRAFESGWVALAGWIFLPYTSLAWMFIYFQNGGRLDGGYLVLLLLAVLVDLGVFSGSGKVAYDRR